MSKRRRTFISDSNNEQLNADMPGFKAYDFDDNVEAFIRSVRAKNRSADTIDYYYTKLRDFRNVLESQGISTQVDRITHDIIESNYVIYLMETLGNRYTTISTKLRAVRAFFNWAVSRGVISVSPMRHITITDAKPKDIETYSREQMINILRQPDLETFVGLRDYAMMTIFLETGVRLREITDIQLDDVRLSDSQIRVDGKNGDDRLVPIQDKAKRVLRRYLKARGASPSDYLFVSNEDGQLSRRGVQNRISKYGRTAGITNVRNSPHTFRHTFAKMSVRAGANIFDLQAILGHKTLEMVRVYVNLYSTEVAEAHKKFSPIENLHLPD